MPCPRWPLTSLASLCMSPSPPSSFAFIARNKLPIALHGSPGASGRLLECSVLVPCRPHSPVFVDHSSPDPGGCSDNCVAICLPSAFPSGGKTVEGQRLCSVLFIPYRPQRPRPWPAWPLQNYLRDARERSRHQREVGTPGLGLWSSSPRQGPPDLIGPGCRCWPREGEGRSQEAPKLAFSGRDIHDAECEEHGQP